MYHIQFEKLSVAKLLLFHLVSLSESQLCFSECVSFSTWHSADNWKQHVSGTLFKRLEHMKFTLSTREKSSSSEDGQTWEQVTQRSWGIFISGNSQN